MLSRTDFIMMTILAAVCVVVVPFLLIFIDVNVWVKIMWVLLAVSDVFIWSRTNIMYREGKALNSGVYYRILSCRFNGIQYLLHSLPSISRSCYGI